MQTSTNLADSCDHAITCYIILSRGEARGAQPSSSKKLFHISIIGEKYCWIVWEVTSEELP